MKHNKWLTGLVCGLALFTTACGGSNATGGTNIQQANTFPGNYLGRNGLGNGQTGQLQLTVGPTGQASGTYTISGVTLSASGSLIPTGSFPITGNVNLTTGVFLISGDIPGFGPFSIQGILPVGNNVADYQININGTNFTGQINNANQGGNGGDPEGTNFLISGGNISLLNFSPDGSYNGVNPPLLVTDSIGGAVATNSSNKSATLAISNTTITTANMTVQTQVRLLTVTLATGADPLEVGQTYNLFQNNSGAVATLNEVNNGVVERAWAPVNGTTASVTIRSLSDSAIDMEFDFQGLGPNSEVAGNTAAGTFNISGRAQGNFFVPPVLP